jgi:DNA-binding IclR family transcriptional regulator
MQTKAEIKGELAEEYLYGFVNSNRGLSIYDLSERLGWNAEELHNVVKRLEEGGLIRTDESEEEELKRKVYPVGWKGLLPEDVKKSFFGKKSDIVDLD